jgi:hypothetical protein
MAELETTLSYNRFLPPGGTAVSTLVLVRRGSRQRVQDEQSQLALRLWTPLGATVLSLRQVEPVVRDLTDDRAFVTEQVGVYPLAGFGPEPIACLLELEIEPDEIGCEIRATRMELVDHGTSEVLATTSVVVEWTDDDLLSVLIDPQVAVHSGQEQLCSAIQAAVEAARYNDTDRAPALIVAQRLADDVGDETRRLQLSWLYTGLVHSSVTEQARDDRHLGAQDVDTTRSAEDEFPHNGVEL